MPKKFRQVGPRDVRLDQVDDRADCALVETDKGDGKKRLKLRSEKWAGRCWLGLVPRDVELKNKAWKLLDSDETLEIECEGKKGNKNRGEVHRLKSGSLKWEVVYASAADLPDLAQWDVSNPPGLEFFYQPALTAEEIAAGDVRPDDVVGSYAAYWPSSGRILNPDGTERVNYETGKYAHLYRPKWIAANGDWAWGEQAIANGVLSVPVPLAWIQSQGSAAWPLTLDPTIGYTSVGGTNYGYSANWIMAAGTYTAPDAGDATSVSIYASNNSTEDATVGVYSDSTPSTLIGDSAGSNFSVGTFTWNTISLDAPSAFSSGATLWPTWQTKDGGTVKKDTVSSHAGYVRSLAYSAGSLPSPFGSATLLGSDLKMSAYLTYTAAAAGKKSRMIGGGII